MAGICEGRVVVVTGAGGGLGRAHALEFAREGARVVVNDLGVSRDGKAPEGDDPASKVVAEIKAMGGDAISNRDDVADWDGAERMVKAGIEKWGRLDVVVNNAGFLRDRMFVNATADEWDAVIRVHLRGHFCVARHAAAYWRERSKAGDAVDARIINTSSGAGILGSVGQSAYSTAKAGILGLTLVQSAELARIGVTANALAPAARTRMTEPMYGATMAENTSGFDAFAPDNVSPLVVWLGSADSKGVTGQVFDLAGGMIRIMEGWHDGPSVDSGAKWDPAKVGPVVRELLSKARKAQPVYSAS
jgi:NAD(P)-dependent dehydrogenase (short-subunit alcohol dehydrogenase family)